MAEDFVILSQQIFNFLSAGIRQFRGINDNDNNTNKKYVLSNSQSVQCNFIIFDHVMFIKFKICCVQNFIEFGWFLTEIMRYIDFQNGGRPPSWNCFTTIRDHPRSFCCWPQLTESAAASNRNFLGGLLSNLTFSHIKLEMPGPKMGVLGDFGPLNVIIHHRDPQKAHPCVNPRLLSYQL